MGLAKCEVLRRVGSCLESYGFLTERSSFVVDVFTFKNELENIIVCPEKIDLPENVLVELNVSGKSLVASRVCQAKNYRIVLEYLQSIQKNIKSVTTPTNVKTLKVSGFRTSLPPQICVDKVNLFRQLREVGMLSGKNKPLSKNDIINTSDYDIIKYFNNLARIYLSFYRCVDNIQVIKEIVSYFLRYSLVYTLANKHKLPSSKAVFCKYGDELSDLSQNIQYIDLTEISNIRTEYLTQITFKPEVLR